MSDEFVILGHSPNPRPMDVDHEKPLSAAEARDQLRAMVPVQKLIDRFTELWGIHQPEQILDLIDFTKLEEAYEDLRKHLRTVEKLVQVVVSQETEYLDLETDAVLEKFFAANPDLQNIWNRGVGAKLEIFYKVKNSFTNLRRATQEYIDLQRATP